MITKCFIKNIHNDFKCSTIPELVCRVWDIALTKCGCKKILYSEGWMSEQKVLDAFGNKFLSKSELCRYLKERTSPVFFFSSKQKYEYQKLIRQITEKDKINMWAEALLKHQFNILGQIINFDEEINWHFSTIPNKSWPLKHWSNINITGSSGYGDIKPVWELNRLQHFPILGRAYWHTEDQRFLDEFQYQLKSWIKANPAEIGINWQSNLEVALRSKSLIWALSYFIQEMDEQLLFDAIRILIHSGRHIDKHIAYSDYCIHNNHFIGEAAGLALISMYLPELNKARQWKKKSLNILCKELQEQVFPDGVNTEQAISYHRFVFYLFLLPLLMEQRNGGKVPEDIWGRLEKMVEYVHWMLKSDGILPMIGDGDDGEVILLNDFSCTDVRSMLATGAVLFNRADFKASAGDISEEVVWLLGHEGVIKWGNIPACTLKTGSYGKAFSDGGYYILRSGWGSKDNLLVFKNGLHSNHAHADQLHIELSAFGKDLLIDSGTYVYNENPQWRKFFRSTMAHNTVVVDKQSQSMPYRTFRWVSMSKPEKVKTSFGNKVQWMFGGHTGYQRYNDSVTHRRGLLNIAGEYIIVVDDIVAQLAHNYQTLFHFEQGIAQVNAETKEGNFLRTDGVGLLVKHLTSTDTDIKLSLHSGQTDPKIQGWISHKYGEKVPAPVLIYESDRVGSWIDAILLKPYKDYLESPVIVATSNKNMITLIIKQENIIDNITYKTTFFKNVHSDCQCIFSRFVGSNLTYSFATEGSYINIEGVISLHGDWKFVEIFFNQNTKEITVTGDIANITVVNGDNWRSIIN